MRHVLPDGSELALTASCREAGPRLVTRNAQRQYIESFSSASVGSEVLVQVIGPREWTMKYV